MIPEGSSYFGKKWKAQVPKIEGGAESGGEAANVYSGTMTHNGIKDMPQVPRRIIAWPACLLLLCLQAHPAAARPDLVPGEWKNITPPAAQVDLSAHIFCQGMAIDPNDPSVLYLCVCGFDVSQPVGLYKSVDGGSTWKRVGNLDEPVHVAIDPADSKHLYAVDGVRGNTLGFWISKDGGETWTKPDGFVKASADPAGTEDLYSLSVEPGNFDHVLVSYHSPWKSATNAGVMESTDGGTTWTAHNPPAGSANGYGMSVFFLDYPGHGIGDAKTWLFTAQQGGFFRTTDGGASWSQVYDKQMTHGGNQIYCSKSGVLYSGGYQYPARSADGGKTWGQVTTGLDYSWYMGITGDGKTLYTAGVGDGRPFFVSSEADGMNWTSFRKGAQTFSAQGPFEMFCDSANGIVYSAEWGGLYALKTDPQDVAVRPRAVGPTGDRREATTLLPGRSGILARDRKGKLYTLPGRSASAAAPSLR